MLTGMILLFIIVPLAELATLLQVGQFLGVFYTLLAVILTAVIGVWLLRCQGASVLWKASQTIRSGSLPAKELIEGFFLALAGALLLTPGFLTDTVGFLLLIPSVRIYLIGTWGSYWISVVLKKKHKAKDAHNTHKDDIIEGEYRELD